MTSLSVLVVWYVCSKSGAWGGAAPGCSRLLVALYGAQQLGQQVFGYAYLLCSMALVLIVYALQVLQDFYDFRFHLFQFSRSEY